MTSYPRRPVSGRAAAWPAPSGSSDAPSTAEQAGGGAAPAPPAEPTGQRLAALSYLGVPLAGPCLPLVIYLLSLRRPGYIRRHSVQALNLSLTMLLYGLCALIVAAMLALDSFNVALAVVLPLAAALWLATLGYAVVASASARRGGFRQIPGWLCATIVR
jgi:Domain of unknown function (DUF4870)